MTPLHWGFRYVGVLSILYASIMLSWLCLMSSFESSGWKLPNNRVECYLATVFFLTPIALLFGGGLLLSNQSTRLRTARWVLVVAGILLLSKAVVISLQMTQEMKRDPSAGLLILLVPAIILPASIWGITVLITGILLCIRVRRPE